jgi:hypothetical protein
MPGLSFADPHDLQVLGGFNLIADTAIAALAIA